MRTFDPWIGSRYHTDGFRGIQLLILGESHYGKPEDKRSSFTKDVIRDRAQQRRFRFFTVIQRLVSGGRGWLSNADRAGFWEQVAFYNYIQAFPGEHPRCRPTPALWSDAREPFLQTLAELSPQLLLVLGHELSGNLPKVPVGVDVCRVPHPSSRGFRYDQWQPEVRAALDAILTKTNAGR
jgi:hypothetical protein